MLVMLCYVRLLRLLRLVVSCKLLKTSTLSKGWALHYMCTKTLRSSFEMDNIVGDTKN